MVPKTFDVEVNANTLTSLSRASMLERSNWPSDVSGTQRSLMPRSATNMCHGTMLAWCSMCVRSTVSPAFMFARPHDRMTKFNASVAFLVKMTS